MRQLRCFFIVLAESPPFFRKFIRSVRAVGLPGAGGRFLPVPVNQSGKAAYPAVTRSTAVTSPSPSRMMRMISPADRSDSEIALLSMPSALASIVSATV